MALRVTLYSPSSAFTQRVGAAYAHLLAAVPHPSATVIFLHGDLGSGKTTFVKGFVRYFGIAPRGISPTFVLMKHYVTQRQMTQISDIYHIDAYRLQSSRDLAMMNIAALLQNPHAVIFIEWPKKIASRVIRATHHVDFLYGARDTERKLTFH